MERRPRAESKGLLAIGAIRMSVPIDSIREDLLLNPDVSGSFYALFGRKLYKRIDAGVFQRCDVHSSAEISCGCSN